MRLEDMTAEQRAQFTADTVETVEKLRKICLEVTPLVATNALINTISQIVCNLHGNRKDMMAHAKKIGEMIVMTVSHQTPLTPMNAPLAEDVKVFGPDMTELPSLKNKLS